MACCEYILGKTCVGFFAVRGKVHVILPTCLCCTTEAWLSLLLEVVLGNVLKDPVLTPAKGGGGQEELWQYQDFRRFLYYK